MIEPPRRSVTRFFIPLIDVLTLLFCIFLLLPLVKSPDAAEAARPDGAVPGDFTGGGRRPEEPRGGAADLMKGDVERLRSELLRLRQDKVEVLQERLAIRVLEIDADTGRLYFQEPEGRVAVAGEADARALIERQRATVGGRELYFLILFPRRLTGYPQQQQVRQFERWFDGVAHGFDNPRAPR
jgi:hypothetical protein